jgi:hypothetical protein
MFGLILQVEFLAKLLSERWVRGADCLNETIHAL